MVNVKAPRQHQVLQLLSFRSANLTFLHDRQNLCGSRYVTEGCLQQIQRRYLLFWLVFPGLVEHIDGLFQGIQVYYIL